MLTAKTKAAEMNVVGAIPNPIDANKKVYLSIDCLSFEYRSNLSFDNTYVFQNTVKPDAQLKFSQYEENDVNKTKPKNYDLPFTNNY